MEWHNKEFQLFMCFLNYLKYFSHLQNAGSKSLTLLWVDSATRRSSTAPLLLVNTLELKALCKPWISVVIHTLPGFRHHHLSWEKACTSFSQTLFSNSPSLPLLSDQSHQTTIFHHPHKPVLTPASRAGMHFQWGPSISGPFTHFRSTFITALPTDDQSC